MGRPPLFEEIARTIEKELSVLAPRGKLPRIEELSTRYRVSLNTMSRAISILRDRGLVESRRGRGVFCAGAAPAPDNTAARTCADSLEREIASGTWTVGNALPKTVSLIDRLAVSPHTLSRALKLLAERDVIHKKGRKWLVGPPTVPREMMRGVRADAPVVLVVLPGINFWYRVQEQKRTCAPFFQVLQRELGGCGIRLAIAFWRRKHNIPAPFPAGREQITRAISVLGKRYYGAILFRAPSMDMGIWQRGPSRLDKPVVLFDDTGEGEASSPVAVPRELRRGVRIFRYLRVDHRRGTELALETLVSLGHRRIGIPLPVTHAPDTRPSYYAWMAARAKQIRQWAGELTPPVEVIVEEQPENLLYTSNEMFWSFSGSFYQRLADARATGAPVPEITPQNATTEILEHLCRDHTPTLRRLLREHRVSAIIGLNDNLALGYYHALYMQNIRIPGDVSLISFDNIDKFSIYPVSTVDFGFSHLGYCAAHILIRDIPIGSDDHRGTIRGKPALVDRGSLAPAPPAGRRKRHPGGVQPAR